MSLGSDIYDQRNVDMLSYVGKVAPHSVRRRVVILDTRHQLMCLNRPVLGA